MYVKRVQVENIRSLETLELEFPPEGLAGWHVILGSNGSGKSSLLRSIALALVGPHRVPGLDMPWANWLRLGTEKGRVALLLEADPRLDRLFQGASGVEAQSNYHVRLVFTWSRQPDRFRLGGVVGVDEEKVPVNPREHVWNDNPSGWFSASFGPFRRFESRPHESYDRGAPRLARHATLFDPRVVLTESLAWLQALDYRRKDRQDDGAFLDQLRDFVNQEGFLPHDTKLHSISSAGVVFTDGNGFQVPIVELSDGYHSILSLTLDLIRQLVDCYGPGEIFRNDTPERDDTPLRVIVPGVVLIDEPDAHLHPTWQRLIGLWFRKHFPNIQFIVATHSPLICQAAEVGTVWKLPAPGSDEQPYQVSSVEFQRLVYGNVLDAYSTGVFGLGVTRSDDSKKKLKRLALLNRKKLRGLLSDDEKEELLMLRSTMPTAATGVDEAVKDVTE